MALKMGEHEIEAHRMIRACAKENLTKLLVSETCHAILMKEFCYNDD